MIVNARTILPIGKSPISQLKDKKLTVKLWVVDMTEKQISILKLSEDLLHLGLLEEFQLFSVYPEVKVINKSNARLMINNKIIPLPSPEPLIFLPSQIFQKLQIPFIKMSEIASLKKLSANRNAFYYYTDIHCIKNCTIVKSLITNKEVDGWEYQIAYISITDYSTEGFITTNGLEVRSYFFCWVHPDFAYPQKTIGDAYGVLRKNKSSAIVFDLCFKYTTLFLC